MKKEMETKLFQDKQKEQNLKKTHEELNRKQMDFLAIQQDTKQFETEESQKRRLIKDKYMDHVAHVKNQMKEEPRKFAKTGIAIISTANNIW